MVQDEDTGLTPEEQDRITDRILEMLAEVPTPTDLGNTFRELGGRLDFAPSILSALSFPQHSAYVAFVVATPDGVRKIADDLGVEVTVRVTADGVQQTVAEFRTGTVLVSFCALSAPERELHRPVDVTETIEEQEQ